VKLVLEALHHDGVSWATEIPIAASLGFIVLTLTVTTVLSLLKSRREGARIPPAEQAARLQAESEPR
jgi:tellurite resistance protein TerC